MKLKFLGQFMVARGLIDAKAITKVLSYQRQHTRRIGEYAVAFRFLTNEQTQRVHAYQLEHDLRFGDAARQLGLLSGEQVRTLLKAQEDDHVSLGDAVVALQLLTQDDYNAALEQFMEDQTSFAQRSAEIPHEIPNRINIVRTFDIIHTMLGRAWGLDSLPGRVTVQHSRLGLSDRNTGVTLKGDWPAHIALGVPAQAARTAGRYYIGEDITQPEEQQDLVREFVNVVCGQLAAQLSVQGTTHRFNAPADLERQIPMTGTVAVTQHMMTSGGIIVAAVIVDSAPE